MHGRRVTQATIDCAVWTVALIACTTLRLGPDGLRAWRLLPVLPLIVALQIASGSVFGLYRGREETVAFLEEWSSAFEPFELTVEEITKLDATAALVVYSQRARPVVGGPPETLSYAQIVEVAEGRITRVRTYTDVEQARRAGRLQRDPA